MKKIIPNKVMRLVEKHVINKNNVLFKEIDSIAFLSKNLYNKANFIIREDYIPKLKQRQQGIKTQLKWIRYNKLQKQLQDNRDIDYYALPTKVSQHVLRQLDDCWESYHAAARDYKKNPKKYKGEPQIPKYKKKLTGRNVVIYTNQAISMVKLIHGIIKLSKTDIKINTKQRIIKQVRIVPKNGYYIIEVIYEKEVKNLNLDKNKIAGIDIGIINLATVTSNQNGVQPLLINGRPLMSMNQYFNKKLSKLKSFVSDKSSNRIVKLCNKRQFKIDNYIHNASKAIVDHLINNDIGTLVIGKNKFWKHKVKMDNKSNQKFVSIPHTKFIQMIKYKCELVSIDVVINEEHFTSMCSFIDNESIEKHAKYLGKRKKRGLFTSFHKKKINADCNASGNIIRKVFPNAFANGIQGVVVRPIRVTPYKTLNVSKIINNI